MDKQRWERLQTIIDRIAAAPVEERDALITDECDDDPDLMRCADAIRRATIEGPAAGRPDPRRRPQTGSGDRRDPRCRRRAGDAARWRG